MWRIERTEGFVSSNLSCTRAVASALAIISALKDSYYKFREVSVYDRSNTESGCLMFRCNVSDRAGRVSFAGLSIGNAYSILSAGLLPMLANIYSGRNFFALPLQDALGMLLPALTCLANARVLAAKGNLVEGGGIRFPTCLKRDVD